MGKVYCDFPQCVHFHSARGNYFAYCDKVMKHFYNQPFEEKDCYWREIKVPLLTKLKRWLKDG